MGWPDAAGSTIPRGVRLAEPVEGWCIVEVVDSVSEFVAEIDTALAKLNGGDAVRYAVDRWASVWEHAVANAYALGLPDAVEGLGGPFPPYLFAPDSPAAKAIRDQLRSRLVKLRVNLTGNGGEPENVTVEQFAILAIVTDTTVGKVLSGWRKAGHPIPKKPQPIPYRLIQPLAVEYWTAKAYRFPPEFSEAKKIILAARQTV